MGIWYEDLLKQENSLVQALDDLCCGLKGDDEMALEYTKSEDVRPYESIIVVNPAASEENKKKIFQKNKSVIEGFKGNVHSVETWGTRKLANSINKLQAAEYFHSYFTASPEAIIEIERTLGINDEVLRVMHSRLDSKIPIEKHVEAFRKTLKESQERISEVEARKQKKRDMRDMREQKMRK